MKITKSFGLKAVSLLIASIILAIAIFAVPTGSSLAKNQQVGNSALLLTLSAQDTCETDGGTWHPATTTMNSNLAFITGLFGSPTTADNGTCVYAAGSTLARAAGCPVNAAYHVVYSLGTPTGSNSCVTIATDTNPFSQGKGGGETDSGPLKDNTTIDCINNYNCSVTFPAGSCEGNCIAGPFLPDTSKNLLPDSGVYGTAYVQMFNSDGTINPSGTYTVCFDTAGVTNPVLYQFVSGAWVARISGSANPLCYSGSGGTGAFYLGGS